MVNDFFVDEVFDFNLLQVGFGVFVEVDVDGEMGVDVVYFVFEVFGDVDDYVFDDGFDGVEGGDVFVNVVVDFNGDDIVFGVCEGDSEVIKVFGQFVVGVFDGDLLGFDGDFDCNWGKRKKLVCVWFFDVIEFLLCLLLCLY